MYHHKKHDTDTKDHTDSKVDNHRLEETSQPTEVSQQPTQKRVLGNKLLLGLLGVLILTGAAVGFRTYQQFNQVKPTESTKKVISQQTLVRRSKIPGTITRATTAKIIDVKTGKVIQAARVFSVDDKTIYLSLDLNKPPLNTRIDYIRYLNSRYVDHGSIKITKPDTQNLAFVWTVNRLVGSRPDGKYKVATYTNGILEKRVKYEVVKNKVANVSVEEVGNDDPDYRLTSNLLSPAK